MEEMPVPVPKLTRSDLMALMTAEPGSELVAFWKDGEQISVKVSGIGQSRPGAIVVTRSYLLIVAAEMLVGQDLRDLLPQFQRATDKATRWVENNIERPEPVESAFCDKVGADAVLEKTVAMLEQVFVDTSVKAKGFAPLSQHVGETVAEVLFFIATGKTWEEDLPGFGKFGQKLTNRLLP